MNGEREAGWIGRAPANVRQAGMQMLWIGIWLIFMSSPVAKLLDGGYTALQEASGWSGLAVFITAYLVLVSRQTSRVLVPRVVCTLLLLGLLALVLTLSLGSAWLVLFVYVAVSCGAVLPLRAGSWAILGVTALMFLLALPTHHAVGEISSLVLPALLGGFGMTGVRQLIRTTVELGEARATVAQLAANEERLRMARDLHDLLGHSLSLITLKSELAGRMLPDHTDQVAAQIADIEQVSRQALTDVREAVTGYRRPTLPGELAGARTALAAAGITADVPSDCAIDGISTDQEAALAWALREGVTNVVRHSGARRCTVTLTARQTLDGRRCELRVVDDGPERCPGPTRQRTHRADGAPPQGRRLARHGDEQGLHAHRTGPRRIQDMIRLLLAEDQSHGPRGPRRAARSGAGLRGGRPGGARRRGAGRRARPGRRCRPARHRDAGHDRHRGRCPAPARTPGLKVVVLTTFGRPGYLRRAMESGAHAFLVKDAPASQLASAVRKVLAGERVIDPTLAAAALADGANPLTDRERDVLHAAADGSTNAELAAVLHLSQGTVRNYLSTAIQKLAARNRAEAVRIACEKGWL